MPVDLLSPRPDIIYLKRRIKPGQETQPVTTTLQQAPTTAGLSLDLSRPASTPTSPAAVTTGFTESTHDLLQRTEYTRTFITGKQGHQLKITADEPVARLTKLQSITGSLSSEDVDIFGWETMNRDSGLVSPSQDAGDPRPIFGNRKFAEFEDRKFILSLRHSNNLRRLVLHSNAATLTVNLYSTFITMDTDNGNNVLYISSVNGQLELRLESVGSASIDEAFNFLRKG